MPSFVNIFATFLGENPIARRNRPAGPLDLPDDFARDIGTLIRQGLLDNRERPFRLNVAVTDLPAVDLE